MKSAACVESPCDEYDLLRWAMRSLMEFPLSFINPVLLGLLYILDLEVVAVSEGSP